jgi:hypothetical protein
VTINGVGTVVLAANQAGNTNYHAAAEVTTSFIVTAAAAPSAVIRNGDLLMDVGVTQNIKVTFNSVYQTIYTRVTGLPAGMRYTGSPDGFLSGFIGGTPLASGTYNVTIATSYKTSETSETINTTKTIVYTVNEAGDPAILLSNQNLTVGTSVNIALRASDVSAVLAWSATGLPAGLVCGTGTSAAITGTPTTAGTSTSTVTLSCRKINSTETTTVTNRPAVIQIDGAGVEVCAILMRGGWVWEAYLAGTKGTADAFSSVKHEDAEDALAAGWSYVNAKMRQ